MTSNHYLVKDGTGGNKKGINIMAPKLHRVQKAPLYRPRKQYQTLASVESML